MSNKLFKKKQKINKPNLKMKIKLRQSKNKRKKKLSKKILKPSQSNKHSQLLTYSQIYNKKHQL